MSGSREIDQIVTDEEVAAPVTTTNDASAENKSSMPEKQCHDPFLVTFQTPYDSENPKNWPTARKWLVTSVLSASGFNRIMVSTIMAPALPTVAAELSMSYMEAVMSMSVYLLATAFGPLVIGPMSEMYGRGPVLHATNIWFLIWNILCGFAHQKGTLLAARLFAGFGASAIYSLGGGVLGDIWRPEQRGRSLALYMLIPLLGAAVGPIVGGYITELGNWRWIFWSTSCFQALMVLFAFISFKETYAPTILHRRAVNIRRNTGDDQYQTEAERLDADQTALEVLQRSLTRPMRLLLFHPIIQIQACVSAFNYGITYLVLSSFADLWTTQYHESISKSGLHYIAMCIGEVGGAEITGPLMDMVFGRLKKRNNGVAKPEYHIPMMLPGAALVPVGLFLYGWAAEKHAYWLVIDIGAAVVAFGITMGGQPLQGYVIDSYPNHTGSATAATQFLRSLTAFGFPLFAPKMYETLGYGWGNSMVAFCAIFIGIPAPILIWIYGPRLRARASSSY